MDESDTDSNEEKRSKTTTFAQFLFFSMALIGDTINKISVLGEFFTGPIKFF